MILVPVKNLRNAKQRLAPVLDQASRTQLAHAMITDVLETLASWDNRPQVAIVTTDPYARDIAKQFDFRIIADDDRSETDAIDKATALCVCEGVKCTLVLPGDIPLIRVSELEAIASAAPGKGSVLAPAADGRGTNAAYRSPADLFPLRFGNDSFRPHLNAARASGLPCVVLSLPGIALDIDNPADLQELADAPGQRRSQQLARQWDLRDYALAANE
jgi:2-phospho-L-lactate/phosphoenolpyruvate guanylyltransferase